nr:hypothetical protein [Tanacetum cinerariifolium]
METELMLKEKFLELCEEVSNFVKEREDLVQELERSNGNHMAKETVRLLRRRQKHDLYKMTRLQMMVNQSHLSVRENHTFGSKMNLGTLAARNLNNLSGAMAVYIQREINASLQFAVGLSQPSDVLYNRVNEMRMLSFELNLFGDGDEWMMIRLGKYLLDDNGTVDMNGTMDNLEDRISNLEKVFAYLKTKKMIERKKNQPNKETPSSDDTADENIAKLKAASKSKGSTSKPEQECILGLAAAHTCACIGNKTFGTRKTKDAIVADQDRKGKKKVRTRGIVVVQLKTKDRQLTLYKFNIDDHNHPIITTIEIPNGLHQGRNFLQSFSGKEGSYAPMLEQIDLPGILKMQRRLFESRGCLLLVCKDGIGFREFTIYEMMKGCSIWTFSYVVNTDEFMTPLPERWSI